MHHVVDHIGGIRVGGSPRGLTAAALVNGHIDDDRTGLHGTDHIGCHKLGRRCSWNQYPADDQISFEDVAFYGISRGEHRVGGAPELLPVSLYYLRAPVYDPDVGSHADCNMRGVSAHHTGSKNDHFCGVDTGDSAEQHTESAVRMFQAVGTGLNRHAARDFGHWRQQWQSAGR